MGTLPVAGAEEEKQTNEIKTAIPLLEAIDIQGKTITADALLTQRELARYLVEQRHAHYHFTVKGNQRKLLEETAWYFDHLDRKPDHTSLDSAGHGRIETRNIWVTSALNDYLNFPHVGLAFMVERITIQKKAASKLGMSPMGLPVKCRIGPAPHKYFGITASTGASRTAAITSSTGIMTKTAAAFAKGMAQRI